VSQSELLILDFPDQGYLDVWVAKLGLEQEFIGMQRFVDGTQGNNDGT
jgi:hypothetical protein